MSETAPDEPKQSFTEWLTDRLESARETYKNGPRSENPRQSDIALGKLRAYRDARTEFLNRQDSGECGRDHSLITLGQIRDVECPGSTATFKYCPYCGQELEMGSGSDE